MDLLTALRGGANRALRDRLVRDFDLDTRKRARSYSKGNRQKVALIAAFVRPAQLYVLDEPASGLDPVMEELFRDEVRRVRADGATVLLSSHLLAEIEALCDRVTIVRAGRVVGTGTLAEMRHLTRSAVSDRIDAPADRIAALEGVHELVRTATSSASVPSQRRSPRSSPPSAATGWTLSRSNPRRSGSCSSATTAGRHGERHRDRAPSGAGQDPGLGARRGAPRRCDGSGGTAGVRHAHRAPVPGRGHHGVSEPARAPRCARRHRRGRLRVLRGLHVPRTHRRDLGAALLPERPGRATGRLHSSLGLAFRLHRGTVAAWAVGGALTGLLAGVLGTTAIDAVRGDPSVVRLLGTLVPGGPRCAPRRVRRRGRRHLVRPRRRRRRRREHRRRPPRRRGRPDGSHRAAAGGPGRTGPAPRRVGDGRGGRSARRRVHHGRRRRGGLPRDRRRTRPVLVHRDRCTGLAASSARPRGCRRGDRCDAAARGVLGGLGCPRSRAGPRAVRGLLRVPGRARQVSPFTHTPGVPAELVDWSAAWWLLAVAAVLGTVALVLAHRREVRS
ncbi:AAA family ATPase [Curtobacterium sp. TC1]|nr:AAA family ATPase [Curtobacterium sp. TC1]